MPHHLVKSQVELQVNRDSIAVFFKSTQVARHARSQCLGGFTPLIAHMPEAHQQHQQWTPKRLISWGAKVGPHTKKMVPVFCSKSVILSKLTVLA